MKFKKYKLNGKTALITGAAGVLGIEHASALLESGAKVILTDISNTILNDAKLELEKKFKPENIIIKKMDVTNIKEIEEVAKGLEKEKIRIDILINNAAIDPKVKKNNKSFETTRLENFELEQWNLEIAVGLTGAFLCSQKFGTAMAKDKKGGVILNIASDLSVISPDQRLYHKEGVSNEQQPVKPITYSVIKTGLIGLTRYLATYWPEMGIRCNSLSPGGVFIDQPKEFTERINKLIPLGRMANKNEYREAVQFMCSDASSYMNGQNLIIDGGRSTL